MNAPNIHPFALIGGLPQHFKGFDEAIPPEIHDDTTIREFTSVDCGTVRPTVVGKGTYIMSRCNIGHDAIIGQNCQIADSVVVAGHCEIGDNVRIGIGALILPYVKVGAGARIGAGAVVTKDIPAGMLAYGNPAKVKGLVENSKPEDKLSYLLYLNERYQNSDDPEVRKAAEEEYLKEVQP